MDDFGQGLIRDNIAHIGDLMPRVTVAIPVYNGANFIAEAIDSVLCQSFTDFELLIVDNASTDGTQAICRKYATKDSRVRYIRNPVNLGASANYNRGHELARGEFLKWLAHDDWISPNFLEECVAILDAHPEFVIAHGSACEMLDRHTRFYDTAFTVPRWGLASPAKRFAMAMESPRTCHAIFGVIRRSVLDKTTMHRPYYTSDRNLFAELALLGRFACAPEAVFYNRKHNQQSMAIATDLISLNTWQDASNTKKYSSLHLSRLKHFWEVIGRHPEIASRGKLLRATAGYMFSPSKLVHYADETLWRAMPGAYSALRAAARRLYRALRPATAYIQPGLQPAPATGVVVPVAEAAGQMAPATVQKSAFPQLADAETEGKIHA